MSDLNLLPNGPIAFGGSLIRDFANLPGILDAFVTKTVEYERAKFDLLWGGMATSFGHTNGIEITDDLNVVYPQKSLLILGANGQISPDHVVVCFKFVPLEKLYSPLQMPWF